MLLRRIARRALRLSGWQGSPRDAVPALRRLGERLAGGRGVGSAACKAALARSCVPLAVWAARHPGRARAVADLLALADAERLADAPRGLPVAGDPLPLPGAPLSEGQAGGIAAASPQAGPAAGAAAATPHPTRGPAGERATGPIQGTPRARTVAPVARPQAGGGGIAETGAERLRRVARERGGDAV